MIKMTIVVVVILFISACKQASNTHTGDYNIVWDSPSKDHHGSMPLGNGSTALNVWVEEDGDLCLYIGRTDSWGENGRLLKVGKVRIICDPPLVSPGGDFSQELDLKSGIVRIHASRGKSENRQETELLVWVDANNSVITVSQESTIPVQLTAIIELWRKKPQALPELCVSDLLEDRSKPGSLHEPVIVEADVIMKDLNDQIGWYHHNSKSVGFDLTNALQGLSEYFQQDPILHRTFGGVIAGNSTQRLSDTSLVVSKAIESHLDVHISTKHPSNPDDWYKELSPDIEHINSINLQERLTAHEEWWQAFWQRSWINARQSGEEESNENSDAYVVSRAYALQRFIEACAGRGSYPIKFNGSLFTVPYEGKPGNADYRRWGPGYWWQNTRLPYLSMCTSGDYDLLQPFFNMYAGEIFQTCLYRTKKYFGFDGAYYPECMYFWGSVFTSTYGWEPFEKRKDKLQEGGWHKWEWVSGPEFVFMMLDYYDHTLDHEFLQNRITPVANAVITFFDQYYKTDNNGKLTMYPSQALETWWDCTNPMPEIAGLRSICQRLLKIPESQTNEKERVYWKSFLDKIPELPTRETPSGLALAPAERFENKRNSENPSLYAVFPFRLIALGQPNLDWGKNALSHRWDEGSFGWRQDDIFMTYMGMTKEAQEYLVDRARTFHEGSRFPAFWGPNYDWIPDQDHGGVLMKTFQSMLIQNDPYSNKIYLFPAWPDEWDCQFKLHAPYQTIIQGMVKNGQLINLEVLPRSREKDIIVLAQK